jgi:Highly conserved protein containing a thioredoxin domain
MYDKEYGGFGIAPKFPQPTFHALLLQRGFYEGRALINVVTRTLVSMGSGVSTTKSVEASIGTPWTRNG